MWKQGKRQTNSFAPTKQQNNNYRRNNRSQNNDGSQDRQSRADRNYNKRPQTYNRNQTIDSQGPDVKVRGTLAQITDKYVTLARDANLSGDRILAENLLQHAEHYTRILKELTPPAPASAPQPETDPAQMPQPSIVEKPPKALKPTPPAEIQAEQNPEAAL